MGAKPRFWSPITFLVRIKLKFCIRQPSTWTFRFVFWHWPKLLLIRRIMTWTTWVIYLFMPCMVLSKEKSNSKDWLQWLYHNLCPCWSDWRDRYGTVESRAKPISFPECHLQVCQRTAHIKLQCWWESNYSHTKRKQHTFRYNNG